MLLASNDYEFQKNYTNEVIGTPEYLNDAPWYFAGVTKTSIELINTSLHLINIFYFFQ